LKNVEDELLASLEMILGCAFVGWTEETDIFVASRAFIVGKSNCVRQ
jgi:hypothetical protein